MRAGVIEPASATPGVVEDEGLIGANAVVIEGCRIGRGAVVAAGAVVISDVPPDTVVAGCPARIIKRKDETSDVYKRQTRIRFPDLSTVILICAGQVSSLILR